jgi:hypothetical protein
VQRIFADIAAGKPLRAIAHDLTQAEIPTPKDYWRTVRNKPEDPPQGVQWQLSTIDTIARNRTYTGQHSAFRKQVGKRKVIDPVSGEAHRVTVFTENADAIPLPEGVVPPLISSTMAEAVA